MNDSELERYIILYRKNVIGAAMCYVRNTADAEDIAQEVFIKLYTYGGSFESDEHVKAWLLRCTINLSKSLLRSYWHKFSLPLEAAGEKAHYDIHSSEGLLGLMARLSKSNRIAMYLHYYEGYDVSETARLLGIKEDAVFARLSRGRKQLRKLLDDERNDTENGQQRIF